MCVTDRHDMTLAIKLALNLNTTNQKCNYNIIFIILYIQTEDFPPRYAERLFGKNVTVDEAMAAIDENQDGEVT